MEARVPTKRLSFGPQDSDMAGMTETSPSEAGLAARLWGARVMVGEDECGTLCLESHVLVRNPGYLSPRAPPPS